MSEPLQGLAHTSDLFGQISLVSRVDTSREVGSVDSVDEITRTWNTLVGQNLSKTQ